MYIENSFNLSNTERSELVSIFQNRVHFNTSLAPYVAYKVGGPADILIFPRNESELNWISKFAKSKDIPLTIIGRGTNLLVTDLGIRGISISLLEAFNQIYLISETDRDVFIQSGGGVEKQTLLNWATERGYTGLEFSAGVPGTLGGGIYMNAGTKYGCYGDIVESIRFFDFQDGAKLLTKMEMKFGYRQQSVLNNQKIVLEVNLKLTKGNREIIQNEISRIINERALKQPLDYPSCGSTFKNPKGFSAGRLIERAGLKGLVMGGAQISTKHANFILNKGNAKASDILTLISTIKNRVNEMFSVKLECEVIVLGES